MSYITCYLDNLLILSTLKHGTTVLICIASDVGWEVEMAVASTGKSKGGEMEGRFKGEREVYIIMQTIFFFFAEWGHDTVQVKSQRIQ